MLYYIVAGYKAFQRAHRGSLNLLCAFAYGCCSLLRLVKTAGQRQGTLLPQCNIVLILLASILFSGCLGKTQQVNLYRLYALNPEETAPVSKYTEMTVIMPVHLAPQLQQSGPIFRMHPVQNDPSPVHLWTAPLDKQLTQVIAANLSRILQTPLIAAYPGPRYAKYTYQVEVEVQEFAAQEDTFFLQAVWTVSNVADNRVLHRAPFSATSPVPYGDYSAYAQTGSQLAGELSREIALYLLNTNQH